MDRFKFISRTSGLRDIRTVEADYTFAHMLRESTTRLGAGCTRKSLGYSSVHSVIHPTLT